MLTAEQIAQAKREYTYDHPGDVLHQHDDCIRMAYEWLDAQPKLKNPGRGYSMETKHMVERWAGRYVSRSDVEIAAHIHPDINGSYPNFNIGRRLVLPSVSRLKGISEAGMHPDKQDNHYRDRYKTVEDQEAA